MELGLKDKVILVTGGASGIGQEIVKKLQDLAAIPIVIDRVKKVEAKWGQDSSIIPEPQWITVDLVEEDPCRKAVGQIIDQFGRIDGLVNNAGMNDGVGLTSSLDQFRSSIEANLIHYFTMAHLCFEALKKNKGTIVNIGSKVSFTGQGCTSGYAASKGGITSLTREWAVDLAAFGVRVNAVIPGEIMTPMYDHWLRSFESPHGKLQAIATNIPLEKRMATSAEVAMSVI
ncbi:MAG: SDR family NAD(P)-dependent oxidoreductase, partial [Planktomarina sp.]|nr:SDR family NAD(P)-dependent oxidoreductase [Planktomarina sp.]